MLFLAASKGSYFQWTQLEHNVAMRIPERTDMKEHCSSTEFSSAAEI